MAAMIRRLLAAVCLTAVLSIVSAAAAAPAPAPPTPAFNPTMTGNAPALAWQRSVPTINPLISADGSRWFAMHNDDGFTLDALDSRTGASLWQLDFSQLGAFRGCSQHLAFNHDESIIYVICDTSMVYAVNSTHPGSMRTYDYDAGVDGNWADAQALYTKNLTEYLFTSVGGTVYGMDLVFGGIGVKAEISNAPNVTVRLYRRDPDVSAALYAFLYNTANPTEPSTNQVVMLPDVVTSKNTKERPLMLDLTDRTPSPVTSNIQSTWLVLGVTNNQPRKLDPTAKYPARIYIVAQNLSVPAGQDNPPQFLVLENDAGFITAGWSMTQSPELAESIIFNPYYYEPNTAIVETIGGMFIHPSSLSGTSTLRGYSSENGQLVINFPLSYSLQYAKIQFDPVGFRMLILTERLISIIDFSSSEQAPTYLWNNEKIFSPTMQNAPTISWIAQDGLRGDGGGVAFMLDATLRLYMPPSIGALMAWGVDANGFGFQSMLVTVLSSTCDQFSTSCKECQGFTVQESVYTCAYCGNSTCVPMFSASCASIGGGLPYVNTSSSECAAIFPNDDHPVSTQWAFFLVLGGLIVVILIIVIYHVRQNKLKKEEEHDSQSYLTLPAGQQPASGRNF